MTTGLLCLVVLVAATAVLLASWHLTALAHRRRIDALDVRIHVNGIRGKSSVTRLLAGVLREGAYTTVAKTTGSAARVIHPSGAETPIRRFGAATINEQVDVVRRHVGEGVDALVIECMAVRPLYQSYAQDFIVRADITVITNVRLDHQEEMGETLEEIADSLSLTIPRDGVLITAEERPELRARLEANAAARGSRFVYADPIGVPDGDLRGFDYLQFKENIAVGYAVADELGIPRDRALAGMRASVPDVGVVRLRTYDVLSKRLTWVPLFAANDRESVVAQLNQLIPPFRPDSAVIALLNNRADRGRRAELFADMVPGEIGPLVDDVVLMGAFEKVVAARISDGGYPSQHVHLLGDTVRPNRDELLAALVDLVPGDHGVLIGLVNIHTAQAELLIDYFAELDGEARVDELALSRQAARVALPVRKIENLRRAARAHVVPDAPAPRSRWTTRVGARRA